MTCCRWMAVPVGLSLLLAAGGPAWAQPATAGAAATWGQAPAAGAAPVQVYPVPGTRTVSPGSQISFRGVASLPQIEVLGSVSGPHLGRVVQHRDRAGASFVPAKPFTPGETITVRTPLAVTGSTGGTFTYTVARPTTASPSAPSIYPTGIRPNATTAGPYRSRPDLLPPKISVTVPPGTAHAPGLNFASSGQATPTTDTGILIYDDRGQPVWVKPLPPFGLGTLSRITYPNPNPKPGDLTPNDAITWFEGTQIFRGGYKGAWVVADKSYTQIAQIAAGNKLSADAHELRISPDGKHALLDIYNPITMDMTAYGGPATATVYEAVVQEVELNPTTPDPVVTFEWHSLGSGESPLSDSYIPLNTQDVDYFHLNAMEYDTDGGILVTGRQVSATFKLARTPDNAGNYVQWRLGGKRSTYTFRNAADVADPSTAPSFPHDVRRRADGTISLYDNAVPSTGLPGNKQGRGIVYKLDDTAKTATATETRNHVPDIFGVIVGSNRPVGNGGELVSYGNTGTATEYDKAGTKVWESQFGDAANSDGSRAGTDASWTYRTLRVDGWHATPAEAPALAADFSGSTVTGYASWNGATDVASWALLAGPSATQLRQVSVTPRTGFETTLAGTVTAQDTVLVAEARDAKGTPLRRSTGLNSSPIQAHYNALGGASGFLGPQTTAETALGDGSYAAYQNGVIYYSPATGAWEVHGAILGDWSALGAQGSALGYPTSDERGTPDGVGRYNLFAKGSIYWTAQTGANEVHGGIGAKWTGLGAQGGFLGYPLTNELGTGDGRGRYNDFQGGSVYYSPTTGTFEVHGAIRGKWAALGGPGATLGYPTTDESPTADGVGRFNRFEQGSVRWSPTTGAFEVHGAIGSHFAALGEERGPLGYPTSDESTARDGVGRFNSFQRGVTYWSPATGAQEVHGAIRDKWAALGAETGLLGYPTTDEGGSRDGIGRYNGFQGGMTFWSPATGAHAVQGAILGRWLSTGTEAGTLGYPVTDEYAVPGGRRSDFQRGSLVWDAATGNVTVQ